jgi:hypothetical protein
MSDLEEVRKLAVKWKSDARRTENVAEESVEDEEGTESLDVIQVMNEERSAILGWGRASLSSSCPSGRSCSDRASCGGAGKREGRCQEGED